MVLDSRTERARHRQMPLGDGGIAEVWLEVGACVTMRAAWQASYGEGRTAWEWTRCRTQGCRGSAICDKGTCYSHSDDEARTRHSERAISGEFLDLCGNEISVGLWQSAVDSVRLNERPIAVPIVCLGARFTSPIRMERVTFARDLSFAGAIFEHGFSADHCDFDGGLDISYAETGGEFRDCCIADLNAEFSDAERPHFNFRNCTMTGRVNARGARGFQLEECVIQKTCDLSMLDTSYLSLRSSEFHGDVNLADTMISYLNMESSQFFSSSSIGPVAAGYADLQSAQFKRRAHLTLTASRLNMRGCSFHEGGRVECSRAELDLTGMAVAGPLLITGSEGASVKAIENADCGHLTLSSLDLTTCRFYASHDLQDIVLEPTVSLSPVPGGIRSQRRCIADEISWRAKNSHWRAKDWSSLLPTPENQRVHHPSAAETPALTPAQVASVYRSLRKSVEAQSDEPGACDFYYGEMEMRRHDYTKSAWERVLIWAYWLISGYGLRGFRSLLWLLILLAAGSLLMNEFGLKGPHSLPASIVAAAQSIIPGLSVSARLTDNGSALEIVLRIFGPVLLALTALALRNRIRR